MERSRDDFDVCMFWSLGDWGAGKPGMARDIVGVEWGKEGTFLCHVCRRPLGGVLSPDRHHLCFRDLPVEVDITLTSKHVTVT